MNYDIEVCVDCTMMLANGECEGVNPDVLYHAVKANGMTRFDVALNIGEDTEPAFSMSDCDYCGSRLGGDRYPAVVFGQDEDVDNSDVVCRDCGYPIDQHNVDGLHLPCEERYNEKKGDK